MALRIGIIGLGHGSSYLHLVKSHPETELGAVVDLDEARRNDAAAKYGGAAYESVGEMLAAGVADVAIIALPTPLHAETSIACLEAGLDVLQEKPLCRTDEEAAALRQAAEASGKVFQVAYEVRSSPLHQTILERIAAGDIGELTSIWYNQHTWQKSLPHEWRYERGNMGGKLFDCAVHYFDLIQQWAGAPVCRLVALGNLLGRTGACTDELPQTAVVSLEYANGVRGTFNFGAVNQCGDDASFGVVGTTGRIMGNPWLPQKAGSYELRRHQGVEVSQIVFDVTKTSGGHLGWKEQFSNFVKAVKGEGPNVCPISDAIAIHEQMVALDKSMATGQVVDVEHRL